MDSRLHHTATPHDGSTEAVELQGAADKYSGIRKAKEGPFVIRVFLVSVPEPHVAQAVQGNGWSHRGSGSEGRSSGFGFALGAASSLARDKLSYRYLAAWELEDTGSQ